MPSKQVTLRQEHQVLTLYQKGFSAPLISNQMGLSVKQIYSCLKRFKVDRRSAGENSKLLFSQKPPTFLWKAPRSTYEKNLTLAALMLYQGEGAKTGTIVDFTNCHPESLAIFLRFLRRIANVDDSKLRFYLYCYSNQDIKKIINFWCSYLKVDQGQFTKPYVRSTFNKGSRVMEYGVLHIRYGDKKLLLRILEECRQVFRSLLV